jgi:hypothetical protein
MLTPNQFEAEQLTGRQYDINLSISISSEFLFSHKGTYLLVSSYFFV